SNFARPVQVAEAPRSGRVPGWGENRRAPRRRNEGRCGAGSEKRVASGVRGVVSTPKAKAPVPLCGINRGWARTWTLSGLESREGPWRGWNVIGGEPIFGGKANHRAPILCQYHI